MYVNSSVAVIRRTAPVGAKVAIRPAAPRQKKAQPPGIRIKAPRQKKAQPPGIRIKAPKRKRKTGARAMTGPSPFKECIWMRQGPDSRITKTWLQSQEKPRLKAPIWVC